MISSDDQAVMDTHHRLVRQLTNTRLPSSKSSHECEWSPYNIRRKFMQSIYPIDINCGKITKIKVLNSIMAKSKYLDVYIQSLTLISYHQVVFIWIPEHKAIKCNEKPDKCSVRGSSLDETMACNNVLNPLVVVANNTDEITRLSAS